MHAQFIVVINYLIGVADFELTTLSSTMKWLSGKYRLHEAIVIFVLFRTSHNFL